MPEIYKHSHFEPDAFGHGGNKRTAQIDGLLTTLNVAIKTADLSNSRQIKNKLSPYLKGVGYNKTLNTGNKSKYAIGRYIKLFETFVAKNKPELFIWESTVDYNLLLAEILYKHHIPVIALPHNIESLVAGSKSVFSNKPSPAWLAEELRYLACSDKCFAISREEHWLLSTAGINAAYLPYYPTPELEKYLSDLRFQKQQYDKPAAGKKMCCCWVHFTTNPHLMVM